MSWLMPALIVILLVAALFKGAGVYDAFVKGASDGLPMLIKILPCMAAMLIAIKVVRASGALEAFTELISPVLQKTGFPPDLVPLLLLRPFSGSAAMSLLADVLNTKGPDSFEGVAASIMMGSTETIFYTVALYFGSVGVKKTRVAVPVALICAMLGAALALIATLRLFAL